MAKYTMEKPAVSAPEKADLEFEELRLKIQDLKQKNSLEILKVVLATIGVFFVAIGWGFDRYKLVDQRIWEVKIGERKEKTGRMTEIANDYDRLFNSTLSGLNQSLIKSLTLYVQLGSLKDIISGKKDLNSNEVQYIVANIDAVLKELSKKDFGLDEYASVVTLKESWTTKKNALTPDFKLLFGEALAQEWPKVAQAGSAALDAKFGLFSSQYPLPLIESFQTQGSEFQTRVRQELLKQNKLVNEPISFDYIHAILALIVCLLLSMIITWSYRERQRKKTNQGVEQAQQRMSASVRPPQISYPNENAKTAKSSQRSQIPKIKTQRSRH